MTGRRLVRATLMRITVHADDYGPSAKPWSPPSEAPASVTPASEPPA
ncbi:MULTISPECIES: hypothetical protein [unclassified Streptomyces]|nr:MULTISPECIES: hypothetical protein [unclassified Streptomyces]